MAGQQAVGIILASVAILTFVVAYFAMPKDDKIDCLRRKLQLAFSASLTSGALNLATGFSTVFLVLQLLFLSGVIFFLWQLWAQRKSNAYTP